VEVYPGDLGPHPSRVGAGSYDAPMDLASPVATIELTAPQRRTMERLIGGIDHPTFPLDIAQRLRDRIEEAVRGLDLSEQLWIGKEKIHGSERCEGLFASMIGGEAPPFEHNAATASGVLRHKAVEVEVGGREELDPHSVAAIAAERLVEREARFAEFWRGRTAVEQDELLMDAVRRLTLFRGTFPPLRTMRKELAPVSELPAKAELLGGALVLSGRIDLVLGLPDPSRPNRATRLAIDLKSGEARREYPEDMRFYSLLMALRFGVPPFRAASLFLESGEWQAEDLSEEALHHAADRVIGTARAASRILSGREPELTPGGYCSWCPRAISCPAVQLQEA